MTDITLDDGSLKPSSSSDQNIILAAKGGGIIFASNFIVYFLRFVFGLVMARMLGAELLGLYTLTLTVVSVVSVIASLGLSAGMSRYIPIALQKSDNVYLRGIIQVGIVVSGFASLLFAFGVFLLAGPISEYFFKQPDLKPLLQLASLIIPAGTLITVLRGVIQGFKELKYIAYEDIALNFVKLVLTVIFIWVGWGTIGAIGAHILAYFIGGLMLFYFIHKLFPLFENLTKADRNTKSILRFTLPLYLSQLLRQFSGSIQTFVLGTMGVMSGVGIYTTVLRLSGVGNMFHNALQTIAIPMISDLHSRGEKEQLNRVYRTITKWSITFNLPIFLVTCIFAAPLLSFFGEDFIAGVSGLIILAFSALFNVSTGVCGSIITMTGHSRLTFINSIITLVLNIVLSLFFIPAWGVIGAALAIAICSILVNTLRLIQVYILLGLWPYDLSFLKPITAALVAAGFVYSVNLWLVIFPALIQLIAGASLIGVIFVVVIILLKLSEEDRLVLKRLSDRFKLKRVF